MKIKTLCALGVLIGAGCVTTGTYDAKVAELNKQRSDSEADLNKQIAALKSQRDTLAKKLDDTSALAAELKKRLEKRGEDMSQLSQSLEEVKGRLEDLRKQKAAADARAEVFHNLVQKLHGMIDSGQLKVVIRQGRMLIALPNDVLFDSGSAKIKKAGQDALATVAQVLSTIPDRHFIVAGHTDNVPIHTERYKSNWELSTHRAVEVTHFLIDNGMKPEVLAAAGYGEYDPVASNDSVEQKAQNRRIEIVLQPNIADLPSLDELNASNK